MQPLHQRRSECTGDARGATVAPMVLDSFPLSRGLSDAAGHSCGRVRGTTAGVTTGMQITLKVPTIISDDAAEIVEGQSRKVTVHAVLVAAVALGLAQIQDRPELLLVGLRAVEEARLMERLQT